VGWPRADVCIPLWFFVIVVDLFYKDMARFSCAREKKNSVSFSAACYVVLACYVVPLVKNPSKILLGEI
jgi:hypothetical protein